MQTPEGALKARQTIVNKYGEDLWKKQGAIGGKASNTGGFYKNPEAARIAGAKGGRVSRRKAAK